ncbi:MAG: hypothetical protein QNJ17_00370 [Desulfocapsaceae bacterium]|nr:hypothetical protein [Desulfocapsaceae bacterium]
MFENIVTIIVILICMFAVGRRIYRQLTKGVQDCQSSGDCGCGSCSASLLVDKEDK